MTENYEKIPATMTTNYFIFFKDPQFQRYYIYYNVKQATNAHI